MPEKYCRMWPQHFWFCCDTSPLSKTEQQAGRNILMFMCIMHSRQFLIFFQLLASNTSAWQLIARQESTCNWSQLSNTLRNSNRSKRQAISICSTGKCFYWHMFLKFHPRVQSSAAWSSVPHLRTRNKSREQNVHNGVLRDNKEETIPDIEHGETPKMNDSTKNVTRGTETHTASSWNWTNGSHKSAETLG